MWPSEVIILEVIPEDSLQMGFVQYDHVVQTFSAHGTDDAFCQSEIRKWIIVAFRRRVVANGASPCQ
jgi:hypothetical protein